jgi:UPF0755 protein
LRGGIGIAVAVLAMCACSEPPAAGSVDVHIARGSGSLDIGRRLESAGLIEHPRVFALYVRVRGVDEQLKAGHYRFPSRAGWSDLVDIMVEGSVVTHPVTIPEGFTLREIAPRLATITGVRPDSILRIAEDSVIAVALGVPGPTLEGYLFPETYRFAEGVDALQALTAMVDRYQEFWGPAERALADSMGLSERQVVTLASIVEEEARVPDERPIIAGVYLNRLAIGMLLQADPTVQYALGTPRARLLYSDIDRVADNPYNTYTHEGLPPGPIASPGEAALRAVLEPADVPYLYFVARPDGSHEFTRTAREHVNAKNRIRRENS